MKSLAVQFGKSEKYVYRMLKLSELIPGIAALVRSGKLSAASGIVIAKYSKKIQTEMLKDHLGDGTRSEWCTVSAAVLEGKIERWYTRNLDDHGFDKTECLKCAKNSKNYDMFAEGSGCGMCSDPTCLEAKNTAFLVAEAEKVVKANPKVSFIGSNYGRESDAKQKIREAGHEFKDVHTSTLKHYPDAPAAPQETDFKKPEDFSKAQERHKKATEQHAKQTAKLDALSAEGKIRVYAEIDDDEGIKLHYKEVQTKDTKSDEELIFDWTAKKLRNSEIAREKTAEDVKKLLSKEVFPASAFTPEEERMMYYFMLFRLRRVSNKALGLKEFDYFSHLSNEAKLKLVANLTEEQKTVIRRDYLYQHLTEETSTVSSAKGAMMLAFAKLHLPEQTAMIETSYTEEYDKKNARLDERIGELKKKAVPAKPEANATGQEQAAKPEPSAKAPKPVDTATAKGKEETKAEVAPTAATVATAPEAMKIIPSKIDGKPVEQPKVAAQTPAPEKSEYTANGQPKAAPAPPTGGRKLLTAKTNGKPTENPKSKPAPASGTMAIVNVPARITPAKTA